MSKGLYLLISLVLVLFLAGNVSAQWQRELEWDNDGGNGNRLWDVAVNWKTDIVPTLEYDDVAIMDTTYTDVNNGPIIQDGIDAECGWFEMGYNAPPKEEVVLTMTGGTLTTKAWIDVGGYNAGYFEFNVSGGEVTVIGEGEGTWEGIWLAFAKDTDVVMDVSGGDFDIFGGLWLGWNADSYALFNMTGGVYAGHYVYVGTWENQGGAGRLNLHGGTMHCKDFCMGPVSHMDITEGVLTCETDLTMANGWLFDPSEDTPISGPGNGVRGDAPGYTANLPMLVAIGRVTAYDVHQGDIITDDVNFPDEAGLRALLKIDYDKTNADMTTVSAMAVDPNLAYNPVPFDMARGVQPPEFNAISWSAGTHAVKHDVYFGTDETAVANADTLSFEYKGRQTGTNYTPDSNFPYEFGVDYFWRIDEVNASDEVQWPGHVWNFTAAEFMVIDDMDSYLSSTTIDDTWVEAGRADITLQTAEGDANYVRNDQSMKYNYKNNFSPYYSEAKRTFSPSMDWTVGGTKAFVLWFHGQPSNAAERMYLRITDGNSPQGEVTIIYEDSNDLIQEKEDAWHEWNIELSELSSAGVDLSNISSITIGFGDKVPPGGTGYVYFDDIRLYPTRCRPDISFLHGDLDGDCTTNSYDMDIMAQTWLMSDGWIVSALPTYNPDIWLKLDEGTGQVAVNSGLMGTGYNGQLGNTPAVDPCDPTWVTNDPSPDRLRCLEFDGTSDFVQVPELNFNSNTVTITAWVKRNGTQSPWAGIVLSREGYPEGLHFGELNELRYSWNNDDTWWWETGLIVPDGLWTFAAVMIEPTQATVLMSDGITYSFVENKTEHIVQSFDGATMLGWDSQEAGRLFDGRIDDVRIYNKSIGLGGILGLAGVSDILYDPLDVVSNIVPRVPDPAVDPNYYPENPDIIDFRDYAPFADGWLETVLWP